MLRQNFTSKLNRWSCGWSTGQEALSTLTDSTKIIGLRFWSPIIKLNRNCNRNRHFFPSFSHSPQVGSPKRQEIVKWTSRCRCWSRRPKCWVPWHSIVFASVLPPRWWTLELLLWWLHESQRWAVGSLKALDKFELISKQSDWPH